MAATLKHGRLMAYMRLVLPDLERDEDSYYYVCLSAGVIAANSGDLLLHQKLVVVAFFHVPTIMHQPQFQASFRLLTQFFDKDHAYYPPDKTIYISRSQSMHTLMW